MPGLSDADVFGAAAAPVQAPPGAPAATPQAPLRYSNGRGITVEVGGADPTGPGWTTPLAGEAAAAPAAAAAPPAPSGGLSDADVFGALQAGMSPMETVTDAVKSFGSGLARAGTNLTDAVLQTTPLGQIPQMLRTATTLAAGDLPKTTPYRGVSQAVDPSLHKPATTAGRYAQSIGEMAPNVIVPGGLVRKAAAVVLPGVGAQGAGDAAEAAGANPTGVAVARFVGGMAGGLGAGVGGSRALPTAEPATIEGLKKASDDAWAAVDASGFRFPRKDVQAVSLDISKLVADEGGKELYPTADAVARRIASLSAKGDLSVAQLNRLRSQVGSKLLQPGSTESDLGYQIKDKLDSLIETSKDPNIANARDLYSRLKKAQAVSDRLDSAGLRSSSTYSGGNYTNAVRQQLRPLVDPTSKQRLRNVTPDEAEALRTAVEGTKAQNALRNTSKLLGNKFVQTGAMVITPHGVGFPLLEAAATGARKAGEAQTQKAVDQVLQLMMTGGAPAPAGLPRLTYTPTGLEPFNLGSLLSVSRPEQLPRRSPRQ